VNASSRHNNNTNTNNHKHSPQTVSKVCSAHQASNKTAIK
jgi:hypothetical protein